MQEVKDAVVNLLYKNQATANDIIQRIVFNEKLRRELAAVKKEAKEKQKKISFKIPKLRDSKYHYQDQSPHAAAGRRRRGPAGPRRSANAR